MSDLLPTPPVVPRMRKTLLVSLIVGLIGGAVIVGLQFVRGLLGPKPQDYAVGSCVDAISLSARPEETSVPKVVDCSDPAARARVVAVHDGKRFSDARLVCPATAEAAAEIRKARGGTFLVCLVRL